MALHSTLVKNHIIENWSFANATARKANGLYNTAPNTDVGKIAYQQDDGSYWRLTGIANPGAAATPTWAALGSSPVDSTRVLVLSGIVGLTGGGATKLDGQATTQLTFGQKIMITINDSDSVWTLQNAAVDATAGDVAPADNGAIRWRRTSGF